MLRGPPSLPEQRYRQQDSDETFSAWLQALADWGEAAAASQHLGKFGQTDQAHPPAVAPARTAPKGHLTPGPRIGKSVRSRPPVVARWGGAGHELEIEKQACRDRLRRPAQPRRRPLQGPGKPSAWRR
ncbi:hypothetical protein ACPA9J_28030 [Pseudomonas aeruginosa]